MFEACGYEIDGQDRVVKLGQGWENSGLAEIVLGRELWSFLSGASLTHLLRHLVAKVRQTNKPTEVSFRCDGPDERLFLRQTITPVEGGTIRLETEAVWREPRATISLTVGQGSELLSMCSWCKKLKVGENWWELENALERFRDEWASLPLISHGMCPPCEAEILESYETDEPRD